MNFTGSGWQSDLVDGSSLCCMYNLEMCILWQDYTDKMRIICCAELTELDLSSLLSVEEPEDVLQKALLQADTVVAGKVLAGLTFER